MLINHYRGIPPRSYLLKIEILKSEKLIHKTVEKITQSTKDGENKIHNQRKTMKEN